MTPEEFSRMKEMFRASSRRAFWFAGTAFFTGFAAGAIFAALIIPLP